jgi:hypothetical protein
LLPELLTESRAANTRTSYRCGLTRCKNWAVKQGLDSKDILPARALQVAIYLASIIQTANTPSPVINSFYSIKWYHELLGFQSPTESKLVVNILEAAKRRLAKPVRKKEPVTIELMSKTFKALFVKGDVKNQRTICACLLSYAGFLRSEELLKLRSCDLLFNSVYLSIFIESSKTDKYRDGAWVLIARTGTDLCPVVNLERYMTWTGISPESDHYIFCNLSATKAGYKLRSDGKHLTYSNFRSLFL